MKIWYCLGCIFGEDKEEVASRSDTVDKDGDVMTEDGSSGGNFGNNNEGEPDEEEEEEEVVAATRLGLALNNSDRRQEGDGEDRGNRLIFYEEMIEAMRTGGAGNEDWERMATEVDVLQYVPLSAFRVPAFNGFRRLQGEGSTSSGGASTSVLARDETEGEDGDRDSHNKRARIYFGDG